MNDVSSDNEDTGLEEQEGRQALRRPAETAPLSRRLAALAVRIVFDLLVLDAAIETWQAASPLRTVVVGLAVLYFVLTAYVLSKGGRVGGRGWLMDPLAPAVVFLGFLVAASWSKEGLAQGVVALRQPTPVVLSAVLCALAVAAVVRSVGPGGSSSWWVRVPFVVGGAYAAASFGQAAVARAPFLGLVTGHGLPTSLPWWLQGTWLGAFVLLPIAFLRELGTAITRLAVFPYLRWMLIFGFACWMVFNAASL